VSNPWDEFLAGFDEPAPEQRRTPDEDPIYEQIDALRDERNERGDPNWFPPGPDPAGLARLVARRRARQQRPE
jgi:hypothetical protein